MRLLVQGVVGSTAYGLATPSSDIDRLGVYSAPTMDVLGLDGPNVVKETRVSKDPDKTLHEIGKFVGLALQGNPTILELLWLDDYEVMDPLFEPLITNRQALLSKGVADRYGGYVEQQVRKLMNRSAEGKSGFDSDLTKRTPKHGRHCYRLLLQGKQLLETGGMRVKLTVTERRLCFAAGRLAEADPQSFREFIDEEMAKFEAIAAKSSLPENPDRELANSLLQEIRLQCLPDWVKIKRWF